MSNMVQFAFLERRKEIVSEPWDKVVLSRWRWLQSTVRWALSKLGAYQPVERIDYVSVPEPLDGDPEVIAEANRQLERAGYRPAALMLGQEHYYRLARQLHPYTLHSTLTMGEARDGRRELYGIPVIINPWMEGATLLPVDVADALRQADSRRGR